MTTWFNGEFINSQILSLPAVGHPWLRGDGIFESIRTDGKVIFFLRRHLGRLSRSARTTFLPELPISEIAEVAEAVVNRSSLEKIGLLRITWFSNGDLLVTHTARSKPDHLFSLGLFPKIKPAQNFINSAKTLSYAPSAAIIRWAEEQGYDDALLVNERNEVVETALTNVMMEFEGRVFTPSLRSGCLPGVTREVGLEWFPEISEASISLSDLQNVSGIALLSSIRLIQEVTSFQGQQCLPSANLRDIANEFEKRAQVSPDY